MPSVNVNDTVLRFAVHHFDHVWPSLLSYYSSAGEVDSDFEDARYTFPVFIKNETVTAKLNSHFYDERSSIPFTLGNEIIDIDNGDTVTRNTGAIFAENTLTNSLTDAQVALKLGVSFSVIRSVRKGYPNWIFNSIIEKFSRVYSYDPNLIRSNFSSTINQMMRSTRSPHTRFQSDQRRSSFMYYGLGDPPDALSSILGDPYRKSRYIEASPWNTAPLSSSKLDLSSIAGDDAAYWVHIWAKRGRVGVTFNNRAVTLNSYDAILSSQSGSSEAGSDGDMRIDEFDPDNGVSLSLADLETFCYFGFTRPATEVLPSDNLDYLLIRVHPKAIRIKALDDTAQVRYGFERVSDNRIPEALNTGKLEANGRFALLKLEAPAIR